MRDHSSGDRLQRRIWTLCEGVQENAQKRLFILRTIVSTAATVASVSMVGAVIGAMCRQRLVRTFIINIQQISLCSL